MRREISSGRKQHANCGSKPQTQKDPDARIHDVALRAGTAFWNAHLKSDPKALDRLSKGGFAKALGTSGTVEQK